MYWGARTKKGRLVRSLAVTHMRINLGLNQEINCPWRGEATATDHTKKVESLARLRREWAGGLQDYTPLSAFDAFKKVNLNLPCARYCLKGFTYSLSFNPCNNPLWAIFTLIFWMR